MPFAIRKSALAEKARSRDAEDSTSKVAIGPRGAIGGPTEFINMPAPCPLWGVKPPNGKVLSE
jgi:hypothetical protein